MNFVRKLITIVICSSKKRPMENLVIVSLEQLVHKNHNYRKFKLNWNLKPIEKILTEIQVETRYEGYGIVRLFMCLLVQFMEDLSDRELEKYLQENNAAKWFCGFLLTEKVPDHTVFCKSRAKIGTNKLSQIFAELKQQLKAKGLISEVFTFVDATHLISKANLWEERGKAIQEKYDKLNNKNISKFASDNQAKIGCKGGNKFWFGYKKHVSVDMQSGMINKVAITAANVTDAQGFKHVCPSQGAAYMDKGYCSKNVEIAAARKNVHVAAIKKNNMKGKNFDLDRFYSKMRAPYERVFSKENKRVRYAGVVKNQFGAFMQAICFNLKRLITFDVAENSFMVG
jgi:IS5 family transposase